MGSGDDKSMGTRYVEGQNCWGGGKKGIRGIFAMGFSDPNERGIGSETTDLLYPWKGEQKDLKDRKRGGESYPPRKETQGATMSMTTNPKWSSLAKPIKVKWMRR